MTEEQKKMIEELKPLLLAVARKSAELGYISVTGSSETKASLLTDNYSIVLVPDYMVVDYHVPGKREVLSIEPNPLCTATQKAL